MKLILAIVLCCSIAAATACNKTTEDPSEVENGVDSTGTGIVNATYDGTPYSASGKSAVTVNRAGTDFSIATVNSSGTRLSILMTGTNAPGTYSLGSGGVGAGVFVSGTSTWQSSLAGGTGSITFTTLTTARAAGTFTFSGVAVVGTSATGTKSVTGGSFDVTFGLQ